MSVRLREPSSSDVSYSRVRSIYASRIPTDTEMDQFDVGDRRIRHSLQTRRFHVENALTTRPGATRREPPRDRPLHGQIRSIRPCPDARIAAGITCPWMTIRALFGVFAPFAHALADRPAQSRGSRCITSMNCVVVNSSASTRSSSERIYGVRKTISSSTLSLEICRRSRIGSLISLIEVRALRRRIRPGGNRHDHRKQRSTAFPSTAEAVVIGGGVNGLSTAYQLTRKGIRPVVLERSHIGAGATGKSGALVRAHYTNPQETQLALASRCASFAAGPSRWALAIPVWSRSDSCDWSRQATRKRCARTSPCSASSAVTR